MVENEQDVVDSPSSHHLESTFPPSVTFGPMTLQNKVNVPLHTSATNSSQVHPQRYFHHRMMTITDVCQERSITNLSNWRQTVFFLLSGDQKALNIKNIVIWLEI